MGRTSKSKHQQPEPEEHQHHQQQQEEEGEQEIQHHQYPHHHEMQPQHYGLAQHQHQMHMQMPTVYGFPVDLNWQQHHQQQMIFQQQQFHHQHMHMYPHPMASHDDGVGFPPGIPGLSVSTDPLEIVLGPFPCARLRNIPFDATVEDILILFQGLVVIDVLIVGPGEAFVLFANPMDYQMGLQRDRQGIGRNMVEITTASRAEYYKAIGLQWQESSRRPLLPVGQHGLRRGVEHNELLEVSDVSAVWGSTGTITPLQSLNVGAGEMIQRRGGGGGGGSIGVGSGIGGIGSSVGSISGGGSVGSASGGSIGMLKAGNNPGRPGASGGSTLMKRTGGGIQVGEHTGFLRMRGLPFSASKDDIFRFFDGYNPVLESIVLTYRSDGRATGEAYVGFDSPDNSKRAMDLHRKSMGSRYIELFLSNKDEHGRALARFGNR